MPIMKFNVCTLSQTNLFDFCKKVGKEYRCTGLNHQGAASPPLTLSRAVSHRKDVSLHYFFALLHFT